MSKLPVSVGLKTIDKPGLPALRESKALAPLAVSMKANSLVQRQAARLLQNSMLSAGLASRFGDPQVWSEWLQLQAAIMQRLHQQNLDWRQGCAILAEDYALIRHANTMSKMAEKQGNFFSQWTLLLTNQASSLLELMENIHVDYGYWASQKTAMPRTIA
ncbi:MULTISPECIES: hypothetical protein [unclassified Duganella]|uniref:hypothetical protein n=1 Tax=unclassified Duganella TaxID=2636909 RepID=UPI0007015C8B|nr:MULTISPECIES: hypothetical protein [unclassified Duganella]KQV59738.1 hypothetical protein ASD07_23255 [Duganella sp. Root336D2]KRB87220.1 hypothetical protein ASE26_07455 [Duganella sp. Root198D2]